MVLAYDKRFFITSSTLGTCKAVKGSNRIIFCGITCMSIMNNDDFWVQVSI